MVQVFCMIDAGLSSAWFELDRHNVDCGGIGERSRSLVALVRRRNFALMTLILSLELEVEVVNSFPKFCSDGTLKKEVDDFLEASKAGTCVIDSS